MADIVPFHGLHFATDVEGGLESVVAPPYDVISAEERDRLARLNPRNIVRVILNAPEPGDSPDAPYKRAAAFLRRWQDEGALVEDPDAALYLYRQTFQNPLTAQTETRTGLFCALKLSPYTDGVVLPHEFTRPAAKADRLALMRATETNTEPIFALYEDPDLSITGVLNAAVQDSSPSLVIEAGGMLHQVFAITDPEAVGQVVLLMAPRRVWIADGHHRYETALTYLSEVQGGDTSLAEGASRILVVLSPFEDPGIVVLPTHRLLRRLKRDAWARLEEFVTAAFHIEPVERVRSAMEELGGTASSDGKLLLATRDGMWLLTLRDSSLMDAAAPESGAAWRRLDVSILQKLILEPLMAETGCDSVEVAYTHDAEDALLGVRTGLNDAAFLVGTPSSDDVRRVTAEGDRMPAKSTFFYPKLWSGLLLRRLGR